MNRFGAHLRAARTRARLSQKKLGEMVDVDDSYISKMETGAFPPPSRDVALKLADALGVSEKADRFKFLLNADAASVEDVPELPLLGHLPQEMASQSTVFHAPLAPSDKEILMHRLAVAEKRLAAAEKTLQAAEKNLRDAHKELRELAALAAVMFPQE
jgi:transcriptional regulator with XRE-family HTH domain